LDEKGMWKLAVTTMKEKRRKELFGIVRKYDMGGLNIHGGLSNATEGG